VVAALALSSLRPGGVAAQETDAQRQRIEAAREHMERGQELYLAGQYLQSAEEFERAYEMQPFGAFLFNAAVSYEQHGSHAQAADFFARYLERDPSARDAAEVRLRIDRLRTHAAGGAAPGTAGGTGEDTPEATTGGSDASTTGTAGGDAAVVDPAASAGAADEMKSLLSVTTNPAGAQVTLKRGAQVVAEGPAPFAHTMTHGDYRVVVEHPDFRTVTETVRVRPGKVYVVIVEMSQGQFFGYLRVVSDVPGAAVYIDGRDEGAAGQTPFENVVATGPHRVIIDRPGYEPIEREIEVGLAEDVEVRVELTRTEHGRLRVVSNVRGADVLVDDRVVGQVPYEGELAAGPHRVRVEADGMKSWERHVEIERGQLTPVRVRLRPAVSRSGAWITGGFAFALLTGGIVMGVLSNQLIGELEDERDAGRLATDDPRFFRGQVFSIVADSALALGGIMGLLSIYYFLRDPLPESEGTVLEPRDWSLAPRISPLGGGAEITWRF
jgi:hypothetical protein